MATTLYNNKKVGQNTVSVGDDARLTQTYKGFSSKSKDTGFKLYDIDLVKQDLINHFYIRKGEKLENPEFGTVIWDLLFEQFTDDVKELISKDVEAIVNYDPRVSVRSLIIDSTSLGIRIEVELLYLPFNVNERMTFNFDKENSIIN
jgi:phage baseplate assembly protein W